MSTGSAARRSSRIWSRMVSNAARVTMPFGTAAATSPSIRVQPRAGHDLPRGPERPSMHLHPVGMLACWEEGPLVKGGDAGRHRRKGVGLGGKGGREGAHGLKNSGLV